MKYAPICFDMDGVIVNSEPARYEAFAQTLATIDQPLSSNDYANYFAGKTDAEGF